MIFFKLKYPFEWLKWKWNSCRWPLSEWILISLLLHVSLSHQQQIVFFFHQSLSKSKSHQMSRSFLNIIGDIISALVCIASILSMLFSSSNFYDTIVYNFFNSLARSR